MNKKLISISILLSSILLSSCSSLINPHEHSWSKYYDDGNGNHTKTCLLDIEHTETHPHNYNDGKIVEEVNGNKCGLAKYTCKDCGYSEVRAVYPECQNDHIHKLDKNIVNNTYLYEERNEYSSIYYKSCSCGAYGDKNYLFEYNLIDNSYSQLNSIITDNNSYIDLGGNNNYSYSYNVQSTNLQSRLPSGYTELEYIESNGTQYIDTKIKPTQLTGTEISYSGINLGTDENIYFGSSTDIAYAGGYNYCLETNGTYQAIAFGEGYSAVDYSFNSNTIYNIEYNINGNCQYKVNDTLYKTFTTPVLPTEYNIYIYSAEM